MRRGYSGARYQRGVVAGRRLRQRAAASRGHRGDADYVGIRQIDRGALLATFVLMVIATSIVLVAGAIGVTIMQAGEPARPPSRSEAIAVAGASIETLGMLVAFAGALLIGVGQSSGRLPWWLMDQLSNLALAIGSGAIALAVGVVGVVRPGGVLSAQSVGLALLAAVVAAFVPGRAQTAKEAARSREQTRRYIDFLDGRTSVLDAESARQPSRRERIAWRLAVGLLGMVPAGVLVAGYALAAHPLVSNRGVIIAVAAASVVYGPVVPLGVAMALRADWSVRPTAQRNSVEDVAMPAGPAVRPIPGRTVRWWRRLSWIAPIVALMTCACTALGLVDPVLAGLVVLLAVPVAAPLLIWRWIWPSKPDRVDWGRAVFIGMARSEVERTRSRARARLARM